MIFGTAFATYVQKIKENENATKYSRERTVL